jgi:DNA-binding MarR family transcriptional regulator
VSATHETPADAGSVEPAMTHPRAGGPVEGDAGAGTPASPAPAPSPLHDPGTAHGQLGIAFKRAMVAVRRLRGRETHRSGQISYAQYGLLFGLSGACERSARELADYADLTPATVTQMLEHLESAGLVTRTRSEQDRRVVLSVLTERGAEVVRTRQAQMEPRWRSALEGFSPEELLTAARVLNRLADYFDRMLEDTQADRLAPDSPATPQAPPQ